MKWPDIGEELVVVLPLVLKKVVDTQITSGDPWKPFYGGAYNPPEPFQEGITYPLPSC
jgi:hypothetical protein